MAGVAFEAEDQVAWVKGEMCHAGALVMNQTEVVTN